MIILGTSILIDYIRQSKRDKKSLLDKITRIEGNYNLGISSVSIQEMYQDSNTRVREKEEEMLDVLGGLKIYAYDQEIAAIAGKVVRDWKPEMEFADAVIAATAINEGCHLFTLNTKNFQNIPDLTLYHLPLWK